MYLRRAAIGAPPVGQAWYKESGSGMGATLNMAAGLDAYALSDRGSWANFKNRQNLRILFEGDPELYNPYGVILIDPVKHPHVKKAAAETFINWITSAAGRKAIADFRLNGSHRAEFGAAANRVHRRAAATGDDSHDRADDVTAPTLLLRKEEHADEKWLALGTLGKRPCDE